MLELGKDSLSIHRAFKAKIEKIDISFLYTVGSNMLELSRLVNTSIKKCHEDDLENISFKILKL